MKIVTLFDTDFTMKILVAILVGAIAGIAIVISKDTGRLLRQPGPLGDDPESFPTLRSLQICGMKHNYTVEGLTALILDWGKVATYNPSDPHFSCLFQCLANENGGFLNETEESFISRKLQLNLTEARKYIDKSCLPVGGTVNKGRTNCSRGTNLIACGLSVLTASLRGELIDIPDSQTFRTIPKKRPLV